ncbi:MAG TPA: hypothetical protein VGK34_01145 [Armatimonadota bacterium]|jgi:hypothetical protein
MLAGYERKCNIFGAAALIGILGGLGIMLLSIQYKPLCSMGVSMVVLGWIAMIFGFCVYLEAKGYPPLLGLIGLMGVLGWIVILVLPDQHSAKNRAAGLTSEPNDLLDNCHGSVHMPPSTEATNSGSNG